MAINKFISAAQVISTSFTNDADTALIKDAMIIAAQESFLRPVLGDDFYEDLEDKVSLDNSGDLNAAEWNLVENYIRPMIAYYVKHDVIPDMIANQTSQGVITTSGELNTPSPRHAVAGLQESCMRTANRLKEIMIKHIEDNSASFSLYTCNDNPPKQLGGIFLTQGFYSDDNGRISKKLDE